MQKNSFKTDLIVQSFVLFPMLLIYFLSLTVDDDFVILALLFQFFVGLAQVLSCIYNSFSRRIAFHQTYFKVVIGYFVLLTLFTTLSIFASVFLAVSYVIVLPVFMACFYYFKTRQYQQKALKEGVASVLQYDEEVLDDILFESEQ